MKRYPKKQRRFGGVGVRMLTKMHNATQNATNNALAFRSGKTTLRWKKWISVVMKWRGKLRNKFAHGSRH